MRATPPFLHAGFSPEKSVFRELRRLSAFSLVEVVVALGIISFTLVTLAGLLPAGLGMQQQAASRARCVQALSELCDAARNIYVTTNGDTNFPYPLEGMQPGRKGDTNGVLLGDGRFADTGDDVRGKIFVRQYDRTSNNLVPVYISVAWPASAVRGDTSWEKAQGSVESVIFVSIP